VTQDTSLATAAALQTTLVNTIVHKFTSNYWFTKHFAQQFILIPVGQKEMSTVCCTWDRLQIRDVNEATEEWGRGWGWGI